MVALIEDYPDNPLPKSRKITAHDVKLICNLVAKRITETGACLLVGIKPTQWFVWKQRAKNKAKFDTMLELIKESQVSGHIENIERFQVKDWRASHALLQIKAPERFGQREQSSNTTVTVNVLSSEAMTKIEQSFKLKQVVDITAKAQIANVQSINSVDTIEQK